MAHFLTEQCRSKLPSAWIFTRGDGAVWSKDKWTGPIKIAVNVGNLPIATSAYTLRHSVITDLVRSGLPIFTVGRLAKDKLSAGNSSISEIAYSVGYGSPSAFSVAFTRIVGRPPTEYVRQIKAAEDRLY